MKILILCLVLFVNGAHALPAEEPVTPAPKRGGEKPAEAISATPASETSAAKFPLTLHVRAGLPLQTQDTAVRNHWSHNYTASYLMALGVYLDSSRLINGDFWAYVGPEFSFLHDQEDLSSGNGSSSLNSDQYGFNLTGGISWQPSFLERRFGAQLYGGLPLWGQKASRFSSDGISEDLGTRRLQIYTLGLNLFWDIDHHWKPFVGYEIRYGSLATLGVNYAF